MEEELEDLSCGATTELAVELNEPASVPDLMPPNLL